MAAADFGKGPGPKLAYWLAPEFPLASDHEFAQAPAPELVLRLRLAATCELEVPAAMIHADPLQSPDALEVGSTCHL